MTKNSTFFLFFLLVILFVLIGCSPPPEEQPGSLAVPTTASSAAVETTTTAPVVVTTSEDADTDQMAVADTASGGNEPAPQGEGGEPPQIDFDAAAVTLGVSADTLRDALGTPPPDFAAAATALGISEDALIAALGVDGGPPPDGGQAGGGDNIAADTNTAVVTDSDTVECPTDNFLSVSADPNNGQYPAPTLSVTCTATDIVISSNTIPSFEFIAMTPGNLTAVEKSYTIPLNPQIAAEPTDIPLLGTVAVVVDGLPIYGPNEGGNLGFGDPYLDGLLDFCGGHIGPDGYHYHARPDCLFSNLEEVGLVIGYALDGFPILSPYVCADESCSSIRKLQSSWQKTSDAEAAWEAHEYVAGSGDLDRCNGTTLSDGSYAYFATDSFPYLLGCYTGTASVAGGGAGPGGGQGGGQGGVEGGPPQGGGDGQQGQGGRGGEPDYAGAAATLGISEDALREALGGGLPPDFEGASAILGISEEALREALPPPGR